MKEKAEATVWWLSRPKPDYRCCPFNLSIFQLCIFVEKFTLSQISCLYTLLLMSLRKAAVAVTALAAWESWVQFKMAMLTDSQDTNHIDLDLQPALVILSPSARHAQYENWHRLVRFLARSSIRLELTACLLCHGHNF